MNENSHLISEEALDLLDQMMKYDYTERITPKDAMKHPYFRNIASNYDNYEL